MRKDLLQLGMLIDKAKSLNDVPKIREYLDILKNYPGQHYEQQCRNRAKSQGADGKRRKWKKILKEIEKRTLSFPLQGNAMFFFGTGNTVLFLM